MFAKKAAPVKTQTHAEALEEALSYGSAAIIPTTKGAFVTAKLKRSGLDSGWP